MLLITLDALRQDHLSFKGYDRQTSPDIDWLAEAFWSQGYDMAGFVATSPGNFSVATASSTRHSTS